MFEDRVEVKVLQDLSILSVRICTAISQEVKEVRSRNELGS